MTSHRDGPLPGRVLDLAFVAVVLLLGIGVPVLVVVELVAAAIEGH